MYVYLETEPGVYTVGHYAPSSVWIPESDYDTVAAAVARLRELNGAAVETAPKRKTPPVTQPPAAKPK